MYKPTEEQLVQFMKILIRIGLEKDQIMGLCCFLKSDDMMNEMVNRLKAKEFKVTPQEAMNICVGVVKENLDTPDQKNINPTIRRCKKVVMISPDEFYEMNLKGKSADQIMTVIRGLKQEIGRLKNYIESPEYQDRKYVMDPDENVQISLLREYLRQAKQALEEAGGTYIPSAAEKKAMEFNANIPHINKVVFSIGGYFEGYLTTTHTIDGDKVHTHLEHSLKPEVADINEEDIEETEKEYLFRELKELYIGEWRKRYYAPILDGTQWELQIYFSNGHRTVKIHGSNAYPYNFDRLANLFDYDV